MVHFTSVQLCGPSVREYCISAMSGIVSVHSEGLQHLVIRFHGESFQLCTVYSVKKLTFYAHSTTTSTGVERQ